MRQRVKLNMGWVESENEFDTVDVGDRLIPRRLEVVFPGKDQLRLEMTIDSSSGVPRCTALKLIANEEGREIRTLDVRNVEIENWIEAIAPLFMHEVTSRGPDGSVASVIRVADSDADYTKAARATLRQAKRASRRKVTPELLRRVAEVYLEEADRPAEAVEFAFGVSARTAYRYISLARQEGFLEEKGS